MRLKPFKCFKLRSRMIRGVSFFIVMGWMAGSQNICPHWSLTPVNMSLFGKRAFADVITLETLRWDYLWLFLWALNPITSIFRRERVRGTWDKQRRRQLRWCEVESRDQYDASGITTAKDCPKHPKLEEGKREGLFSISSRLLHLHQNLDFWLLASKIGRLGAPE